MKKKILLILILVTIPVYCIAAGMMDSVVPNAEAGWSTAQMIGTIFGAGILVSLSAIFHKIFVGFGYGLIVKSWNQLVVGKTALRFGTATDKYDPMVSKIGLWAVWTEEIQEGKLVTDRVPYNLIVDGRVTIVGG
jgi:hypothetical protein